MISGNRFVDDFLVDGFTLDELKLLITKHKGGKLEKQLQKRYSQLWKLYNNRLDSLTTYNTENGIKQILSHLGYSQNTLFPMESHHIVDKLFNNTGYQFGRGYTSEMLSLVIVTIVLDRYRSNYDETGLLNLYDIKYEQYKKLKDKLNHWCETNYWIN